MIDNELRNLALGLFDVGAVKCSTDPDGGFMLSIHRELESFPLSPIYFNVRTPDGQKPGPVTPRMVKKIGRCSDRLIFQKGIRFDALAGNPDAATPFAAAVKRSSQQSLLILQKSPRNKSLEIERALGVHHMSKSLTLLLENVSTRGVGLIVAATFLRNHVKEYEVTDAITIVDRESGAREALARIGVALHPLFTITELLELYCDTARITPEIKDRALRYSQKLRGLPR